MSDTIIVLAFVLCLCLVVGFVAGYCLKKTTYRPFAIRKIQATRDGNTWEFKYPFNVSENTNYIFIVDFPRGQEEK